VRAKITDETKRKVLNKSKFNVHRTSLTEMLPLALHKLKVDESAKKFQGASGSACIARNAHKVINAQGEFVIGLKRTNEPRETVFSSNRPPIAV
jgi:hypothetical protein